MKNRYLKMTAGVILISTLTACGTIKDLSQEAEDIKKESQLLGKEENRIELLEVDITEDNKVILPETVGSPSATIVTPRGVMQDVDVAEGKFEVSGEEIPLLEEGVTRVFKEVERRVEVESKKVGDFWEVHVPIETRDVYDIEPLINVESFSLQLIEDEKGGYYSIIFEEEVPEKFYVLLREIEDL